MSGCDLPDDPEHFRSWQDSQRRANQEHNDKLHHFAAFRRQYHAELQRGERTSTYYEEHPDCACPYEEVLAAYNEKYGIVDAPNPLETMLVKHMVQ
jgi:hypothetical protein